MIVQTQTTSFKAELYQGIHDLTTDVLKLALYTADANLDASTTVYTTANEIIGTGYSSGGNVVTGAAISSSGYTAWVTFNNVLWVPAAFTTRCALLYNVTRGNKSIAVLDFGSDKTCTNTFTVTMPGNTATTALIRSSN
jgi:hypothetical protein